MTTQQRISKLMKVDSEFHDIRTLPGHSKTIAHSIGHPAVKWKVVLARNETELVRAVEIKNTAGFQRVVDLLHTELPVFNMFEDRCGDDAIKTILADHRLLDVADLQIELLVITIAEPLCHLGQLRADLESLDIDSLLLAVNLKPAAADSNFQNLRARLEFSKPLNVVKNVVERRFLIFECYMRMVLDVTSDVGQIFVMNVHLCLVYRLQLRSGHLFNKLR